MKEATTTALVLKIGNRFFSGFSKTGRAQTAWSLAGAKTYLPFTTVGNEWLNKDMEKLDKKKKKYELKTIALAN